MRRRRLKLNIFVTHPVQYHVPLWRKLAQHPQLEVKVFYFNEQGVRGGLDKGFGIDVTWDVDLLGGYDHVFLTRDAALDKPLAMRIPDVETLLRSEAADWILIAGYTHGFERQIVRHAQRHGSRILMRGEFSDLSFGKRNAAKRFARDAYLRWFYAHVARFCYIGAGARAHLTRLGVAPEQLFFSPYSVDDTLIPDAERGTLRAGAREQLGIPEDRFVLILSGKLIPRKNPFAVLAALRSLRDSSRIGLIAVGDGELRDGFTAEARALLGDRFIFPGFVNQTQLSKYFLASDALVMPSLHETWGLVVNEAMHYGLPCLVSSQVGCAPDLIQPHETGYVYESGSVSMLARHLQTMLDDREGSRRMGEAARRHIQGYTIEQSARGVVSALELPASSQPPVELENNG